MAYLKIEENDTPVELYYEDRGRGRPVVLIHGYPLNGASWEKQATALLEDGFRVITYDRRGFGKSSQPSSDYNYDTFADDLNVLMSKLNLKDAILVGFSMGTGEVTRYISTFGSERVSKAVLIGPLQPFLLKTSDNSEGVDEKVFDDIKKAIKKDRYSFFKDFFKNFYNFDKLGGKRVSEEVLEANFITACGASAEATYHCVASWLTDFRNDLPRIDVPTLVLQGTEDRILPFESTGARLKKLIKDVKVVEVNDGPHNICWTHAEEVNRELLDFISDDKTDSISRDQSLNARS